jgi:hypothetical protein
MAAKRKFQCEICGKVKEVGPKAKVPQCCRKPMRAAEKLPVCELSSTAEHSRFTGKDDACDDGRAGG